MYQFRQPQDNTAADNTMVLGYLTCYFTEYKTPSVHQACMFVEQRKRNTIFRSHFENESIVARVLIDTRL